VTFEGHTRFTERNQQPADATSWSWKNQESSKSSSQRYKTDYETM